MPDTRVTLGLLSVATKNSREIIFKIIKFETFSVNRQK